MSYKQMKKDLEVMVEQGKYAEVERIVANIYGWSDKEIDNGEIVIRNTRESALLAVSNVVTEDDEFMNAITPIMMNDKDYPF